MYANEYSSLLLTVDTGECILLENRRMNRAEERILNLYFIAFKIFLAFIAPKLALIKKRLTVGKNITTTILFEYHKFNTNKDLVIDQSFDFRYVHDEVEQKGDSIFA